MRSSLVLCLCSAVFACGGGSDGDSTNASAPLPEPVQASTADLTPDAVMDRSRRTPTPAPAPTPTPVPTGTAANASCGLNGTAGIQAEILQRVNALRAAGAVCGSKTYAATTPLNWNSMLLTAATGHSADMAKNNYFSHTSLDGRTFDQRITAAGYSWSAVGENIAAGQTSVQSVMTSWINSPGHCQNLMNPSYRDIGVACVRNDAATYRLYWTMDLGRSR
ncbi:CAP domain-containing protein [Rhodoferax ferrireducens]|uniref:CAP domain-containing protein n=1 Tax=Rhodoferax ferrireducens TaxID=192843 RepID=UPI001E420473|nr:CAP domain-containing protein [Rhodoferax ferrireducens]